MGVLYDVRLAIVEVTVPAQGTAAQFGGGEKSTEFGLPPRKMSVAAATAGHHLPHATREAILGADEFDLTRSPSHFTPHSYEMNNKRVRSGSISGRLRSASDLEDKGILDRTQMNALKDRIISGDECSIAALDKLAEGDRSDLEALLMSGALNHSTPLDLDLLVNGLIDEVDELGVSDLDHHHPAEGGRGEESYQQFEIEIGDLPFEASFGDDSDHHLLVGSADPAALLGVSPSLSTLFGLSPSDALGLPSFVIIKEEDQDCLGSLGDRFWEEGARKMSICSNGGESYKTSTLLTTTTTTTTISSKVGIYELYNTEVHSIKKEPPSVSTTVTTSTSTMSLAASSTVPTSQAKSACIDIPRPNNGGSKVSVSHTNTTTTATTTTSAAATQGPTVHTHKNHAPAGNGRPPLSKSMHNKNGSAPMPITPRVVIPRQHCQNVGAYSPESRRRRIEKFWEKKKNRIWQRKVKYDVRKNFADSRVRVKGRFVKKEDEAILMELNTLTTKEGISELALLDFDI